MVKTGFCPGKIGYEYYLFSARIKLSPKFCNQDNHYANDVAEIIFRIIFVY